MKQWCLTELVQNSRKSWRGWCISPRDTFKFSVLVGLAGIFIDAVIAHGLFWENDPYWTYWITKTFLITCVFLVGTSFIGIGLIAGLFITGVHTLILEIYYQWLAPVGLPQEPEWLDFYHLWVTGIPAHFLAIFTGYALAVWLWKRNNQESQNFDTTYLASPRVAILALTGSLMALVLSAVLTQGILLADMPGFTFFVQHFLISFVFLYGWLVYGGVDAVGTFMGALLLSLLWTGYNLYVGPRGLPFLPPTYLGYYQLWFKSFPGDFLVSLLSLLGLRCWLSKKRNSWAAETGLILLLVYVGTTLGAEQPDGHEGLRASATASGSASIVIGPNPYDLNATQTVEGFIKVSVIEMGNRWSAVQNKDGMHVEADFVADGNHYQVLITQSMPHHPLARYTTWNGVVFNHAMHGNTGIGTSALPTMKPEVALWGWAQVTKNGQLLTKMAPAHVMVMTKGPMKGIMLEVDTEEKNLLGADDGYLTVSWHKLDSFVFPDQKIKIMRRIGWFALIALPLLFSWIAVTKSDIKLCKRSKE
jgi:hypothetical protein